MAVAVAVDGRGVDGVRIDGLKGLVVLLVPCGELQNAPAFVLDKILEADPINFVGLFGAEQCRIVAFDTHVEPLQCLLDE